MASLADHPLFTTIGNIHLRLGLHKGGATRDQINTVLDGVTPQLIEGVAADAGIAIPPLPGTTEDGKTGAGGQIIQAIISFFGSPQGQQLMAALIKLLLSLIAGGGA